MNADGQEAECFLVKGSGLTKIVVIRDMIDCVPEWATLYGSIRWRREKRRRRKGKRSELEEQLKLLSDWEAFSKFYPWLVMLLS